LCFDSSTSLKFKLSYYVKKCQVGGFSNSFRTKKSCNAEFYYCADDDTVYVVATEDIGPDTEIMVYYPQPNFWLLVDYERKLARKQARAAMTPEELVAAKADIVNAKAIAKAAAVVKSTRKTEALRAAKAVKAAVKAATTKTVKETTEAT
jgi:hypothetical protein